MNDEMGVESCDWGDGCTVDAAYSYWGSADGPTPSGSKALACGAVTVSPYLTSSGGTPSPYDDNALGIANCDGTQSPDDALSQASSCLWDRYWQ